MSRATGNRHGLPPAAAGISAPSDKRFRRSELRPDRRRRIGRAVVRLACWIVPAAGVLVVLTWIGSAAASSSWLSVRRITVRGNARLSSGEVESLLAGLRGQSVLRVNFEDYRRRVLDSPWVADVTLSRQLPSTIDVRLTERVPLVVARLGQQLYLIDEQGIIIDEYGPQYHDLDLPIVDGLVSAPSAAGTAVQADRVKLTGALMTSLAQRPEWRRRLTQVNVSNAHDAVVMFDDAPAWLHLGDAQFVDRLGTYLELAPTLKERFEDLDYVDLRFGDRVFVHGRRPGARNRMVNVR